MNDRIKESNIELRNGVSIGFGLFIIGLCVMFLGTLTKGVLPNNFKEFIMDNIINLLLGIAFVIAGLYGGIYSLIHWMAKPKELSLFLREDDGNIYVCEDENGKITTLKDDRYYCFVDSKKQMYKVSKKLFTEKYEPGKFYKVYFKGKDIVDIKPEVYDQKINMTKTL